MLPAWKERGSYKSELPGGGTVADSGCGGAEHQRASVKKGPSLLRTLAEAQRSKASWRQPSSRSGRAMALVGELKGQGARGIWALPGVACRHTPG